MAFAAIGNKANSQNLSLSELLVNSTIRIECHGDTVINGQRIPFTSTGSGFFFQFAIGKDTIPCIVTNYHVIKGSISGVLRFTEDLNRRPNYGHIITQTVTNFSQRWVKHPTEDLAIMALNPIISDIVKTGKDPFRVVFNETDLPTQAELDGYTAIEEALMIGYPVGFWDSVNNLPVVRKGLTATPIYLNYSGQPHFLLDIPIFPGSSGSPVVLYNQGSYGTRQGGLVVGSRLKLIGINVQSINAPVLGEVNLNNNQHISTTTNIPINVAIVIKASELLAFKPILTNIISKQQPRR
ncbi:serine protease [Mucilaginibacter sp. L3T2-6]|uniref:S1 family peptidase n=1 Tax=Mucilaginibacter sp. L3T2-6 TaxID=3062491 RepID=UPI002674FBF9|nr:serine protease [Mucilaginibacter sp. L3T2-6]MDO3644907.1 serine protease [Mucilaginibacter sp. L3T2-6]MDV6217358.1 serine protease [Mucilaginibacter sp. L3T2-6]